MYSTYLFVYTFIFIVFQLFQYIYIYIHINNNKQQEIQIIITQPKPQLRTYNIHNMDTQLIQQHNTVQQYLTTLFDSLPNIHLSSSSISNIQIKQISQILNQNIQYGKKIIELSDKFTAKYRKDHFIDRKDIQQKIIQIFKYICPYTHCINLDQMVAMMLKKLQENNRINNYRDIKDKQLNINSRVSSINQLNNFMNINNNNKDTKIQYYRDDAQGYQYKYQSEDIQRNYINQRNQKNMGKSKLSIENLPLQHSQVELNQNKRKKSINKSRISKKCKQQKQDSNFTTKIALQIKTYFEQQQNTIRKIFDKFNKILTSSSSSSATSKMTIKISQQNKQYTKLINQSQKDNIKDFVHANIQNTKHNLHKFNDLIDLLQEFYDKKGKIQNYAQGKFNIYIQQINKRQEVFSFTVSKLLENISTLRQYIEKKVDKSQNRSSGQRVYRNVRGQQSQQSDNRRSLQNPLQIIQHLQEISNNFYDLYPSHSILKDLKIQSNNNYNTVDLPLPYASVQLEKIGYKSQGVQVSIGNSKSQKSTHREMAQSKRNLLQLFKTTARVNQMIQKFERSIKFKKNVEQKQIEKFIETIRESFSKKSVGNFSNLPPNVANQVISYQQELKKIIQNNEQSQKQLAQQCNKKVKKYQKQIQQLEKAIQQIIEGHKKQQQKIQTNNRKLSKKLQTQKQEAKKISTSKNNLQKNIKQMSVQITRLQQQIKSQQQKSQIMQKMLLNQNKSMQKQVESLKQINKQIREQQKQQKNKMQEQRQIYHQKIIFLETQQQSKNQQFSQIKYQLQQMIKQNTVLKKQVQELTEVYEDKIRELQQLIENIRQLQYQLKEKETQNTQLKQLEKVKTEKINYLQKQKSKNIKEISNLQQKLKQKVSQAEKYRQLGVLNDSDINILKQQMEKVKQAYIQSQEQLEQMRIYVGQLESDKEFLQRQNRNFRREVENYGERSQNNQLNVEKIQKELRQTSDQLAIKKKQLSHHFQQVEQYKREISKLRKQLSQTRDNNIKHEAQLRNIRQQLHKKTESQSLEIGKRKLQLQATKVELRRKTEQLQKMKENYEQKIEMLESKNKQLNQFITNKQLLAKISNSHLSQ